jgi:hypothetical protein
MGYGASLGLLDTSGGTDRLQYDTMMPVTGSASGSPDRRGEMRRAASNALTVLDIRKLLWQLAWGAGRRRPVVVVAASASGHGPGMPLSAPMIYRGKKCSEP